MNKVIGSIAGGLVVGTGFAIGAIVGGTVVAAMFDVINPNKEASKKSKKTKKAKK